MNGNPDSRENPGSWFSKSLFPFQRALVRGLAVVLPPLLTIVLFIWAWNTVDSYILRPIETLANEAIVWSISDIKSTDKARELILKEGWTRTLDPESGKDTLISPLGEHFLLVRNQWLPAEIVATVEATPNHMPTVTGAEYYREFVRLRYLRRSVVLPAFLALFIFILYLIGKLLAVGFGRLIWMTMERLINRIPVIRNVYSSVKQVTDFAFSENEMKVTRIVAVQYPREGVWSMGFVTGEGMAAISKHVGEPMINVLMPTSPMPATGFTICVRKSDTIDLNITMDQAIQYCVSCGVVTPLQERPGNLLVDITSQGQLASMTPQTSRKPGNSKTPKDIDKTKSE